MKFRQGFIGVPEATGESRTSNRCPCLSHEGGRAGSLYGERKGVGQDFPSGSSVKNLLAMKQPQETRV